MVLKRANERWTPEKGSFRVCYRGSVFCRVKGCFSAVTEGYLGEEEKD